MNLTKKTIENFSVVGGLKVAVKALNAVTLVVLARLLEPSDFGLIALAGLLITLGEQVQDFGVGKAVIQRKDRVEEAFYTGFTLRFLFSVLLFAIAYFIAPYWAVFFENPVLSDVVRVMAALLLLESLSFIPNNKLYRELQFKKAAVPEFLGKVFYSIVTITLAYLGYSYWSLVYGRIAQSFAWVFFLYVVHPWKPRIRFDLELSKELFTYGRYVLATSLLAIIVANLDNAAVGKLLGTAILGYYLIAYKWATFVSNEFTRMLDQVLFPTYAKISEDTSRLARSFMKTLRYSTLLSAPLIFGLFAVAPEFINVLLGSKWAPAIMPLRILCLYGLVRSLSGSLFSIFYALGRPEITTYLSGIKFILLALFIIPVVRLFGLNGVAGLLSIIGIVNLQITLWFVNRELKISFIELSNAIKVPLFASFMLALTVISFKALFISNFEGIFTFIVPVIIGVISYPIFLFIISRGRIIEDLRYLRSNLS